MVQLPDLKQAYKNRLADYSKHLTPKLREEAKAHAGISTPTFNKYMSGDIKKFDVAEKLVEFLSSNLLMEVQDID